jgi:hypothetical protein
MSCFNKITMKYGKLEIQKNEFLIQFILLFKIVFTSYMLCRKKLPGNKRCQITIQNSTHGYCEEHWALYQLGVEFHDPSFDYPFEDIETNELFMELENKNFFNHHFQNIRTSPLTIAPARRRFDTDENLWNQASRDMQVFGESDFVEIARITSELLPRGTTPTKDLERFSKDKQNVHTTAAVKRTVDVANKLISLTYTNPNSNNGLIEYMKNTKISSKAEENLVEYYFSGSSIYNLETPTFKLVFDGLWNYIQNQKTDIRKDLLLRLDQELEDNVGTCAQGNLSRLINVLSGYIEKEMDCVPVFEVSLSDLMANIANEKNFSIRIQKTVALLEERKVPQNERESWLEAMKDL